LHGAAPPAGGPEVLRGFFGVFRYSRRAIGLVWSTNRALLAALALLTIVAGLLPAGVAFIGAQIVDAVVAARNLPALGAARVLRLVLIEGVLIAGVAGAQRGLSLCQALLRAQLGQRVNVMILEKALTLELQQFEDSEFYDKLTRARREASSRPLSLVMRTFGLAQNAISLISYAALLVRFSPWTVLILLLAGLPAFIAEAKFSGDAFRLFRWRSPETRMQTYLETVLAREDHAKEVKLFGLGPRLLQRYRNIFTRLYREDRALSIRRDSWGFALGLVATTTLYGAYAWIALSTIRGLISLGQMTMYLLLFRQGQAAVTAILSSVGGMYEDNLYLSTLYEYLETPVTRVSGSALRGPDPADGVRFEHVNFSYPGEPAPVARKQPGAGGRERLRQDHADQVVDATLHARLRPHPARRHAVARMAGRGPQGAYRRDLPGLHALPAAGRRECRRRRRAFLRGRTALARCGGQGTRG
jgi:ATP-binding cassette subfamily B protein